jgi:DNA polymerase delta subunit 1
LPLCRSSFSAARAPHSAFQLTDVDYLLGDIPELGERVGNSPVRWSQKQAVLRLYGVNDAGNSVLACVHNFMRYFYIPAPQGSTEEFCALLGQTLNAALKDSGAAQAKLVNVLVTQVRRVRKQSVWGYHFKETGDFLQITLALPDLVPQARRLLEKGINVNNYGYKTFATYESTLPYTLRFMVDNALRGGGWVELPAGSYKVRVSGERLSHCQLEVNVDAMSVRGHEPEGVWARMAPMRILSFDIECAGRKGHFPKPEIDPVIQIATCVALQSAPGTPVIKNVFTLNTCAPIAGAQVIPNETEKEMLMGWLQMFIQTDPDIITGYNVSF